MRKVTKTSIKKKLDKLFSEKVRRIGFCQHCGSNNNLQCAHIFSRRNLSIRWDDENAVCLCYRCHIHWSHKEPIQFTKWVSQFKNIAYLEDKIANAKPVKLFELVELLEKLKQK